MAIAINGAGTITGLSAGGLPDDSIITADIANSAVTDGKIAGMASSKLTGTLPAISGTNLTNLDATDLVGVVPTAALSNIEGKGADIASSSTMVIGTDGGYFDITGTTGISTMTVAVGRMFTLQFDGAVVLTNSSTLKLSGAANFTTAAGDHLTFISVAANDVRQIGFGLTDGGSPVATAHTGNVAFPATQVASADANTLDDYEEGTWTPVWLHTSGSWAGTFTATYTKIGRHVYAHCNFDASGTASGSKVNGLSGLPFASNASFPGSGVAHSLDNVGGSGVHLQVHIVANASAISMQMQPESNANWGEFYPAQTASDSRMKFTIVYHV